jgi:beta-ureidopropionase / N-carbamoyl-L-amino-acid hydrolase
MDRRSFARRLIAGTTLLAAAPATLIASGAAAQPPSHRSPRVNGARLNGHLRELARFGRNELGGITRVAYSEADLEARAYVQQLMRTAGLDVRLDTAGNLIGRLAGRDDALPPLMTGSHIDSVPEGGNYDGQVGSMGAVEVAHTLVESGTRLRHPLEVVIFQNEENGKVGSKAMRGEPPANYLDQMTHSGRTVREGIRYIGGDPDRVLEARREPGSIAAFVELHIEQGAILDAEGIDIGVVEGIVGIRRWEVAVTGFANHAGTTPMDRRQDALLAAARFAHEVNRVARARPGRHVATVGALHAEPGAANVIAGRATLALEIRDLDMRVIDALFSAMEAAAAPIARETGTRFEFRPTYRTESAAADGSVRALIDAAARGLGFSTLSLPSGAGHDAQEIAPLAPMGMIFVPSRDGISHSAEEYSTPEDITNGADVLLATLLALDQVPR